MNRGNLRGFAAGLLMATILLGGFYYIEERNQESLTLEELKARSEQLGYKLIKKEEDATPSVASISAEEEKASQEVISNSYQLDITSGMNSEDIADLLQRNGIIDDSHNFQNYLQENKLTTSIQIGSYEMKEAMTYEQIAQTITH